jgi:membrane metallo-endopeptidase-like protein 1
MDEKTRALALKKLEFIVTHIAYPDEFLDNDKIEEFHKSIKIYPESYIKSQLSLNFFQTTYMIEQFRKPVNKTDWISHGRSITVNAFYDPSENSIRKFLSFLFPFYN